MTANPDRINVIDLFAGCGGFTQGFREFLPPGATTSPFRTVGAVEWDIAAASTYAANFAEEAGGTDKIFAGREYGDITHWDPRQIKNEVDVILGGPPCQGFSSLGKEDSDDPRNELWQQYMRVVNVLHPKVFVIENVDRFLTSRAYQEFYASLQSATGRGGELRDYVLEEPRILNAADYGVPQARRRAIILATRRDLINEHLEGVGLQYPQPTHGRNVVQTLDRPLLSGGQELKPWVPVREVLSPRWHKTKGTSLPDRSKNLLGKELPGIFRTRELHIGRQPTEHSLERYAAIPPGGNRHDLPERLSTESWMRHRSGSGDVMGRLHWDRPSVTIRTEFYKPEKGRYLHPKENRPITHMEAALLQDFPMDFKWCGSKVEIARQIGNAVPVGLARAIATEVYGYLLEIADQQAARGLREIA
ncbi:DNA cytosine methyltransferase [Saccharopolyspora pogona]|uniref:DNA cytosine methyltransferase n=1 Tax=Saccharopolyspora pogona TaxID=333966 RepID=UPI001682D279|nr:DNA cytosine methyltransferase [Saccharopolyspora pogona]